MAFSAHFFSKELTYVTKKILFQSGKWSEQNVVALCALFTSDGSKTSGTYFICKNTRNSHVEINFIMKAKKILKDKWKSNRGRKQMVTMVMMISKTPCKDCQTALKDLLKETQQGKVEDVKLCNTVRVNFVLRASNPYLGHGSKTAPEVICELLKWKGSFRSVNVTIEPMIITEEFPRYDEPIDYTKKDRRKRLMNDYKIQYLMEVGRKENPPILINLQIECKLKRLLYLSPSDESRVTIVILRTPSRIEAILLKENCCEAVRSIRHEIEITKIYIYTQNLSCDECLKKIQDKVIECRTQILIIKVANIPDNDKDRICEWITSTRDRRPALRLQLKPFLVVWELYNTNTPGGETAMNLWWPELVKRRIQMDFAVHKKVKKINARLAVNTV